MEKINRQTFKTTSLTLLVIIGCVVFSYFVITFLNKPNYSDLYNFLLLGVVPVIIGILGFLLNKLLFDNNEKIIINKQFSDEIKKLGSMYFTGVTKVVKGSNNITFPEDFDYSNKEIKCLFLGIADKFIPKFVTEELYNNNSSKHIKFLFTLDEGISRARQRNHTINGEKDENEYMKTNITNYEGFVNTFTHNRNRHCINSNFEIKQYNSMPFGILISIGNYIWYSPLWINEDIFDDGFFMVIRHDSELGKKLIKSFDDMFENKTSIIQKI